MFRLLLWVLITTLLSACDDNDLPNLNDQINIIGEASGNESDKLRFEVKNNLGIIGEISITQVAGAKAFFNVVDEYYFEVILPNVLEQDEVILRVNIEGIAASKELNITVVPVTLPNLTVAPEPNVFSSSNLNKHESKVFDSHGIPLFKQGDEYVYYPVPIAAYSYDLYNNYYNTADPEVLAKFLANATWLRDNCIYSEYGFCSYRSYFPIEAYKLDTDWTSAMAQGQAITSLIAAHYITGDYSFATVAYDALAAYLYPLSVKGLVADFDGSPWFEEYGSIEMPAHVLNGFIFSLSGVRSFSKSYGTELANRVLNTGLASLEANIHHFDLGFTSRYDYSPLNQIASTKGTPPDAYHELHVFQLGWAYTLTNSLVIKEYVEKFLEQDMAGIHSVYRLKESSKEIKSIIASHSIDSINYGVDKLIDANWTWNKYWSSNRLPVELKVEVNEEILESKILRNLVLTSLSESDSPTTLSIWEVSEEGERKLLKADINVRDNLLSEYKHSVNDYLSYTVVLNLQLPVTSNELIFELLSADGNIIRLREFDLHFERPSLLNEVIGFYPFT